MASAHKKVVLFSEYKEMSDEIKSYFKPEFERLHDRFDSMKIEFDVKFNSLNNRIDVFDQKFDQKFNMLDQKIKFVFGMVSAVLIAMIISIIANIIK